MSLLAGKTGPLTYEAPNAPEQPATLRFIALGSAGKGPRIIDVLVDPVSWRAIRLIFVATNAAATTVTSAVSPIPFSE
jgi:hypothetical protein